MPHGVFAQGTEVLYNQTKLILRTDGFIAFANLFQCNLLSIVMVLYRSQGLLCTQTQASPFESTWSVVS